MLLAKLEAELVAILRQYAAKKRAGPSRNCNQISCRACWFATGVMLASHEARSENGALMPVSAA